MHSTSLPCASKTGLASRISFRPSETVCTRVAGCPVRMTSGFSTTSSPAALDELHHGMPQHLFAGDAVISAWRLFKCTTVPSTSEMQIPSLKASKS